MHPSMFFGLVPPLGLQRGLGMPAALRGWVRVSPGAGAGWGSPFPACPPTCTSPFCLSSWFSCFFFSPFFEQLFSNKLLMMIQ